MRKKAILQQPPEVFTPEILPCGTVTQKTGYAVDRLLGA